MQADVWYAADLADSIVTLIATGQALGGVVTVAVVAAI